MNKTGYRIGPGAASILLVIVVVSMSILGILALSESKSEVRLSEKNALFVEEKSRLEAEAVQTLALLDAILLKARENADTNEAYFEYIYNEIPGCVSVEDDCLSWTQGSIHNRTLYLKIKVLPIESSVRYEWLQHRLVSAADSSSDWAFDDFE